MTKPLQLTSKINKKKPSLKEVKKVVSKKSFADKASDLSNSKMMLIIPGIFILAIGGVIKVNANYNQNISDCVDLKKNYSQFSSKLPRDCGISYESVIKKQNIIDKIEKDYKTQIEQQNLDLVNHKNKITNLKLQAEGLGLEYENISEPVNAYKDKVFQYKTQEATLISLVNSKQEDIHSSLSEYEYLLTTFTDYNLEPDLEKLEKYTSLSPENQNISYRGLKKNLSSLKTKIYNNLIKDELLNNLSKEDFFSKRFVTASQFVELGNDKTSSKKKAHLS